MAKLFNLGTNKQGLIVYGGESSTDYGMVVSEAPSFERPARKQTVYTVPGRNGAVVFQQDAWEDVGRSYRVWLADDPNKDLVDQVDAIEAWLNSQDGYQRLEDSFEPDIFRLAYFSGGVGFTNSLMQIGEASLKFTCRPERFYKEGEIAITVSGGSKINNPTRFASKPLIHIEGSGSITLSIEGVSITATLADYINIDCETMNAYRLPAENMNSVIGGTFPTIKPGVNSIGISGTVTNCTITPRYFTV